jgi:hypothetical protein
MSHNPIHIQFYLFNLLSSCLCLCLLHLVSKLNKFRCTRIIMNERYNRTKCTHVKRDEKLSSPRERNIQDLVI